MFLPLFMAINRRARLFLVAETWFYEYFRCLTSSIIVITDVFRLALCNKTVLKCTYKSVDTVASINNVRKSKVLVSVWFSCAGFTSTNSQLLLGKKKVIKIYPVPSGPSSNHLSLPSVYHINMFYIPYILEHHGSQISLFANKFCDWCVSLQLEITKHMYGVGYHNFII